MYTKIHYKPPQGGAFAPPLPPLNPPLHSTHPHTLHSLTPSTPTKCSSTHTPVTEIILPRSHDRGIVLLSSSGQTKRFENRMWTCCLAIWGNEQYKQRSGQSEGMFILNMYTRAAELQSGSVCSSCSPGLPFASEVCTTCPKFSQGSCQTLQIDTDSKQTLV